MEVPDDHLAVEVLPHAQLEERTVYQAAAAQARGGELVTELTRKHHTLASLAGRLQPGAVGRPEHRGVGDRRVPG